MPVTANNPTQDQRARWLKHPLRKIHYNEVEYIDLCAAITAEAVARATAAERERCALLAETSKGYPTDVSEKIRNGNSAAAHRAGEGE